LIKRFTFGIIVDGREKTIGADQTKLSERVVESGSFLRIEI
jgi:hypothetical protein